MREPLSDRSQYFIDAAQENGDITGMCSAALLFLGNREVIDTIVGGASPGLPRADIPVCYSPWMYNAHSAALELERYGQHLVLGQPRALRRGYAALALRGLVRDLDMVARFLAEVHFVDSTRGGCSIGIRRKLNARPDFWPHPRHLRHLTSPRTVHRWVWRDTMSVPHLREIGRIVAALEWPESLADDGGIVDEVLRARDEDIAAFREEVAQLDASDPHDPAVVRQMAEAMGISIPTRNTECLFRHSVPVTVRAALGAARMLGSATVNSFVRGDEVVIVGSEVRVVARLIGDVTSSGHGHMNVKIDDPSGARLGGLCVYFEDTPVLDQLVALALHVRAGEERLLLETGNAYALTEAGASHPLMSLRDPHAPAHWLDDGGGVIPQPGRLAWHFRLGDQHAADEKYDRAYRHLYTREVEECVWRGRTREYRRLARTWPHTAYREPGRDYDVCDNTHATLAEAA